MSRQNGLGALRLLFASLVIYSHSFEMIDGTKAREALYRITGSLTLAGVAVDGFFLISGYLITASFMSDPGGYFRKRLLRIVPGYAVCFLLCIGIVAPLAGVHLAGLSMGDGLRLIRDFLLLKVPIVPGTFEGLSYPSLNGSMWTISYEFRCYIMAALLGVVGFYRNRALYLAFAAALVLATVGFELARIETIAVPGWFAAVLGEPIQGVRLMSIFAVGACYRLYGVDFRAPIAAAAFVVMLPLLLVPAFAEAALAILGGYAMFWLAFKVAWPWFRALNAKDDVSYGVYLYAWPIAALILWLWQGVDPWALIGLTLAGALACGWLSWHLIEHRATLWLAPRVAEKAS